MFFVFEQKRVLLSELLFFVQISFCLVLFAALFWSEQWGSYCFKMVLATDDVFAREAIDAAPSRRARDGKFTRTG